MFISPGSTEPDSFPDPYTELVIKLQDIQNFKTRASDEYEYLLLQDHEDNIIHELMYLDNINNF